MTLTLERSKAADGVSLFMDIRKCDLEEWVMASGRPALDCLVEAATYPDTWSILDESGRCLAMWGVTPKRGWPEVGVAWMVATNTALRRVHEMHRYFKKGIDDMHLQYRFLEACSAHHNLVHHRWMTRFGFEWTSEELHVGVLGFRFLVFIRQEGN
jgi:hypothetical protein